MDSHSRKIAINVRTPKVNSDSHALKKARAHLHTHVHPTVGGHKEHIVPKATPASKKKESIWTRILVSKAEERGKSTDEMEHIQHFPAESAQTHIEVMKPFMSASSLVPANEPKEKLDNTPTVSLETHAEPLVPARLIVPKKPMVTEGISMSALSIAYFCMEVGIENTLPTYSGGLGILAGDTLRSLADLKIHAIGTTLLYRKGYFKQRFDESGWQVEEDEVWDPMQKLILLPGYISIILEDRPVRVRAWLYKVTGVTGHVNPLIFLDTNVEGNTEEDRHITARLYSGDRRLRLLQEAVLGIGGVRMLEHLGATNIQKFHMNEGHSALLTLELYRQYRTCDNPLEEVRRRAVFTTHTPVSAGHDVFEVGLARSIIGGEFTPPEIAELVYIGDTLNMTHLGLHFSGYCNGVAKKHGEVSRELFPGYSIESITNGVHAPTWVAPQMASLFDKYITGWRADTYNLRYAISIPTDELWSAHQSAKTRMCEFLRERYPHINLDPNVFTIGFARRATAYKRGNMLFRDIERLKRIAEKSNGIQIIYAGKAHPADREGKLLMQDIIRQMGTLHGSKVRCVYLPDYNMELAQILVSGVDLWLNTPLRPMEASGTSGMKAALNGVPHFSTLDGWWLEGHIENVTGWAIGPHPENTPHDNVDGVDLEDLYTKLEYIILPKFEGDKHAWIKMMRSAIAINGSFFNTQRMVEEYVLGAYYQ